jgi:hypothetical protein
VLKLLLLLNMEKTIRRVSVIGSRKHVTGQTAAPLVAVLE